MYILSFPGRKINYKKYALRVRAFDENRERITFPAVFRKNKTGTFRKNGKEKQFP